MISIPRVETEQIAKEFVTETISSVQIDRYDPSEQHRTLEYTIQDYAHG